jgi:hypothetical protein
MRGLRTGVPILITCVFIILLVFAIVIIINYNKCKVEQTTSYKQLNTYGWYKGQIVYSSHDSLHLVNDSIVQLRKQEAEKQIKLAERIGEMII